MNRSAFTLVETILYVTLFAIITGALTTLYANNLATDRYARSEQELNETRYQVSMRLRDLIQSANQITSPASGTSTTLTVAGPGVSDGPVSLSVTNGTLFIDTASAGPEALSPPDVTVSGFSVLRTNASPPGVDVTMTLTAPGGAVDASDSFTLSVGLRYE